MISFEFFDAWNFISNFLNSPRRHLKSNIWEFIEKTLEKVCCLLNQPWEILSRNINDVFRMPFRVYIHILFFLNCCYIIAQAEIQTAFGISRVVSIILTTQTVKERKLFKSISWWFRWDLSQWSIKLFDFFPSVCEINSSHVSTSEWRHSRINTQSPLLDGTKCTTNIIKNKYLF